MKTATITTLKESIYWEPLQRFLFVFSKMGYSEQREAILKEIAEEIAKHFDSRIDETINQAYLKLISDCISLANWEPSGIEPVDFEHMLFAKEHIQLFTENGAVVSASFINKRPRTKYRFTAFELQQFHEYYKKLVPLYGRRKKLFTQFSIQTESQFKNFYELINDDEVLSVGSGLEEDLVRLWYRCHPTDSEYQRRPANLAIEQAARMAFSEYEPFGLRPNQLRQYLPKEKKSVIKKDGKKAKKM